MTFPLNHALFQIVLVDSLQQKKTGVATMPASSAIQLLSESPDTLQPIEVRVRRYGARAIRKLDVRISRMQMMDESRAYPRLAIGPNTKDNKDKGRGRKRKRQRKPRPGRVERLKEAIHKKECEIKRQQVRTQAVKKLASKLVANNKCLKRYIRIHH